MKTPEKILIARLSSIGDIVLTSSLVKAVSESYPHAKITFLIKREFSSLVMHNPRINQVIVFDKSGGWKALMELRKRLKKENFDWFIDLHNNLRTNFLKLSLSFPEVTSYSKQSFRRWMLVKFGKNIFKDAKPVFLKYFDAVAHRNIQYDKKGTEVFVPDNESESIQLKLKSDGILPSRPLVVICPGASFTNKQWLPERFGEVADIVIGKNARVVFLGGLNDSALCDNIVSGLKYPSQNYAGQLSLLGSAALLNKADLVITNDSGMMHLAQSQKTPVVAIFGPTTREMGFFPIPEKSSVVEQAVSCRPCTTKGLNYCPKEHFNCMKMIEVEDVIAAINELNAIKCTQVGIQES